MNTIGKKATGGNTLFPVFLKLDQLHTLLIGAGYIGLEKLCALLANSPLANITIVAPDVRPEINQLIIDHPSCTLRQRCFEEADLEGKHLVICATGDKELAKEVKRLAAERNIIANVADTPDLCDAYLGSVVQKGDLKIAISTNGKSPTIAKRLKEQFAEMIPDEMESLLDNMQQIRNNLRGDFAAKVKRLNEITKHLVPEKK